MKINLTQALITGIILALIPLSFHLLGRIKKLKPPKFEVTPELLKEYNAYNLYVLLILFPSAAIFAYILTKALQFIAKLHLQLLIDSDVALPLPNVIHFLPALLSAIALSILPLEYFFIKKYGREKYDLLNKVGAKQMGVDFNKYSKNFLTGTLVISSLFFIWSLKTTSYLKETTLTVNTFFSIKPRQYDLKDISEIALYNRQKAPNGNVVNRPTSQITFSDGFKWKIEFEDKGLEFLKAIRLASGITPIERDLLE